MSAFADYVGDTHKNAAAPWRWKVLKSGLGQSGEKKQKERGVDVCECVSVCVPFKLLRWVRVPDGAVQSAIT